MASTVSTSAFVVQDHPIEFVPSFRYLGRILSNDDSDDLAVYARKQKAACVWGRFRVLLQIEGASVETMCRFYRTIIQQVLLFGSETWVLSARALATLERFHARCARGILHRPIRRASNGDWICPPTTEVLQACNLQPISFYIQRRRHTLYKHYAKDHCVLYQQCLHRFGTTPRSLTWWNLDLDSPL